jgi:hypothetical protein
VNRLDQSGDRRDMRACHGCPGIEHIGVSAGCQDADSGCCYVRLSKYTDTTSFRGKVTMSLVTKKTVCGYYVYFIYNILYYIS